MCSYNAMNSTPSCANAEYQNGVLRDAWGWGVANSSTPMEANSTAMSKSVMSPYIVSDCSAIGDMATENYRCSTKPGPPHNPGQWVSASPHPIPPPTHRLVVVLAYICMHSLFPMMVLRCVPA